MSEQIRPFSQKLSNGLFQVGVTDGWDHMQVSMERSRTQAYNVAIRRLRGMIYQLEQRKQRLKNE